ncbi:MAG: aldo/keto reductase [Fusobacteriota bacterium]
MIYRKIGSSDLKASVLGYGAWALGEDGWNDFDKKESLETVELAFEKGVNFFDTAPVYGFGKAEKKLGELFSGVRSEVIFATKCGLLWNDRKEIRHDISRDAIMYDIENSLKRLKTDYIDLYQIHWPDNKTPLEETFKTLNKLKKDGVIKNIGVSNFDKELLEKASKLSEIVSVQNRYNMIQNEAEKEVLPFCKENNIGFIPYSPLAQGMLSGKIDEDYEVPKGNIRGLNPIFTDPKKFKEAINFIKTLDKPLAHTAIQFLLKREEIPTVIASVTKKRHLKSNLKAIEIFEK